MFCALNLSHKRKDYYTKHWWYGISLNDIVHIKVVSIIFLLSFTLHDLFRIMIHLEGKAVVDFFLVVGCAWSLRWQSHLCLYACVCTSCVSFVCVCTYMFGSLCVFIYLFSILKGHCEVWGQGWMWVFSPISKGARCLSLVVGMLLKVSHLMGICFL